MLNVWCVYWGTKYPEYYVHRLKREVEKHLPIPHKFLCLTNQKIEGVETVPEVSGKQGWWQKLDLLSFTGQNLYFDLDTVITGNLDVFVGTDKTLRILKNWSASGHGGCQSSIFYWEDARVIHDACNFINMPWPQTMAQAGVPWGDQGVITDMRDSGLIEVDYFDPKYALSYKYHCRNGLPEDCRVVVFHGDPKPEAVSESWFRW